MSDLTAQKDLPGSIYTCKKCRHSWERTTEFKLRPNDGTGLCPPCWIREYGNPMMSVKDRNKLADDMLALAEAQGFFD